MSWDTLIGVVVGGFLGGGAQILHSYYQRFNEMENLAGSIEGEIGAIARLIEQRDFIAGVQKLSEEIRRQPSQPTQISDMFVITAEQNYFEVFSSNSARIGLLAPHSRDVAYFYTLAKGVLDTNAQLKPFYEVLFKGGTLTGTRGWLADVYSSLANGIQELLDSSRRLIPELEKLSRQCFTRYIFRGY